MSNQSRKNVTVLDLQTLELTAASEAAVRMKAAQVSRSTGRGPISQLSGSAKVCD